MKLRNNLLPFANACRRRSSRVSASERERRLVERVIEALNWLNNHAPGRAYVTLSEALREHKDTH